MNENGRSKANAERDSIELNAQLNKIGFGEVGININEGAPRLIITLSF